MEKKKNNGREMKNVPKSERNANGPKSNMAN